MFLYFLYKRKKEQPLHGKNGAILQVLFSPCESPVSVLTVC